MLKSNKVFRWQKTGAQILALSTYDGITTNELDNWSQNKIKTNKRNTYQQNKNTLSIDNEIIHLTKP